MARIYPSGCSVLCVSDPCVKISRTFNGSEIEKLPVCQNFATCTTNLFSDLNFKCKCLPGFFGYYCEKTPCDRHNCGKLNSFEKCIVLEQNNSFKPECVCNEGFEILNGACSETVCFGESCSGHGICQAVSYDDIVRDEDGDVVANRVAKPRGATFRGARRRPRRGRYL